VSRRSELRVPNGEKGSGDPYAGSKKPPLSVLKTAVLPHDYCEQIWHGRMPTIPSGPSTRRSSGWCAMTAQSARWYTVPDEVA
jgi:hypothetical protein